MSGSIEPTQAELLRRVIESRLADVHVSLPGIVVNYDAEKQVADVAPAVRRVLADEDGDPVEEELPILQNVPVEWPGGGDFYIHFPLTEGDAGTLVWHTRSIAEWRATGAVSTPGDLRLHPFGAVTFRPGLRDDKSPRADAPASGEGVIAVGDGVLRVGASSGSQFVALSNKVDAILDLIKAAIPAVPIPGPGATGDAFAAAMLTAKTSPLWASTAATKLRTK